MNTLCVLLGGNLGNVYSSFSKARLLLEKNIGRISETSSIYKSEAWGFDSDSIFLNQVVIIDTSLTVVPILKETQSIEKIIGRKDKSKGQDYTDRLIDIDILFYNNEIIESKTLTVPHPRLHLRNFTLNPLKEIIPDFTHPKLNKSVNWLYNNCKDEATCIKVNNS